MYAGAWNESSFDLKGQCLELIIDAGKLKYLRLATEHGELKFKLAKKIRSYVVQRLHPGSYVHVSGDTKWDAKKGLVTYKIQQASLDPVVTLPTPQKIILKAPAQILICQKSDCLKRGAGGVCQALEQAIAAQGLGDQVAIKKTGCLKDCKAGPHIVMPDKTRHHHVKARHVPPLIQKYISQKS